ncbi:hypothetical protein [Tautonia sociabilis]|uniref:Uncharacterized protein n=1 Tax=Tautonia sociabilis TaxID=2080755 RepID=A0A432MEK6_9BACT|nr:hypothetical protein [Tautonia sociabilis]RUL83947.1 hypothetical protein TsocGM_21230 [Tautonia sociabilis]
MWRFPWQFSEPGDDGPDPSEDRGKGGPGGEEAPDLGGEPGYDRLGPDALERAARSEAEVRAAEARAGMVANGTLSGGSGVGRATGAGASPPLGEDMEQVRRIEAMPKEVGVLLMVAGVGGVLLPGPVGSPFLVLGGLILWPKAFRGVEDFFVRKFPKLHHRSVRQISRFLDDLERRYPRSEER